MARTIEADGDRWVARVGERREAPGTTTVVFFCKTTDQRPYRVAEVPEERVAGAEDLEALSERELLELFRGSGSMGTAAERAVKGTS